MALAVGGCTVDELLERLTPREYFRWQKFEQQFGPLGPERLDYLAAQISFYVVRTMGGKKAKKVKFPDVFLDWCPEFAREMRLAARLVDPDDDDEQPGVGPVVEDDDIED